MPTTIVDAGSLLVIDVGAVSTRAMLFDIVDNRYRFLAAGSSPSTVGAPYHNISEGVRRALDQLQSISGTLLIGPDEQLIMPANPDGSGVDLCAATISAGAPLNVVAVGLLEDISVESARRLASSTYSKVVQQIGLNDRRKPEARIDAIIHHRPDLIIAAGGTEDGASQSVLQLLESVGLACYLLPKEQRPEVLFAGNQALKEEVQASMQGFASIHFAPNIRPSLEVEQLDAAQAQIAQILTQIRSKQIPGVQELNHWARGSLVPGATAFGRVVRFLSKTHSATKGVLGIDIGASATTVAAAFGGDLHLGVYPQLGLGGGLSGWLEHGTLAEINHWLPVDLSEEKILEYLQTKANYPGSLPVTTEELAIEQAIARQCMQKAIKIASSAYPEPAASPGENLLPLFEPILLSGSIFSRAPSLPQAALLALDGIQPTGATTFVLDQNQLALALGAAAVLNPLLTVQVLDSNSFLHLGTVVAPVGNARPGTPVLRVKITYENGHEASVEVKQGALEVLPLSFGQSARLQLHPLHRYNIGMGAAGRGGALRVTGGALGVVIDARGRPLVLPQEASRRAELYKKWLWMLGGE
jgi:hypothetical protein